MFLSSVHPGVCRDPGFFLKASTPDNENSWVPAFAGMSGI